MTTTEPAVKRGFEASDLTPAMIDQYRRDGFIQIDDVFVGDELQAIRDAVAGAVEEENSSGMTPQHTTATGVYSSLFIQKVNLWQRHPKVAEFVRSRRLGNIAARLEGVPMRVWHDQALFKEPGKGNNKTPWHQDAVYWPHQDRWHQTTIWIALKDATTHNGCMSFINGTHALGPLPAINLGNPQDIFDYAPHIKPVKPQPRPLKAGSATFHNGLTFHYAGPNKSDAMREAFAIIYMPDGIRYDGKGHICTDPMGLKVGDKLEGESFPKVSD
jgi:ectoine hydroxylase-related dioxygenase (phytanoyl-CoA dioxygenase family)